MVDVVIFGVGVVFVMEYIKLFFGFFELFKDGFIVVEKDLCVKGVLKEVNIFVCGDIVIILVRDEKNVIVRIEYWNVVGN